MTARVVRNGRAVIVAQPDGGDRSWLLPALAEWGHPVQPVRSFSQLLESLDACPDAVLILDPAIDDAGGLETYGQILLEGFSPRVLLLSSSEHPDVAARGLRMGAHECVDPTQDADCLRKTLGAAIRNGTTRGQGGSPLLGDSSAMKELRALIRSIAATDAAVMIIGESGTGKELVARAIHDCSHRTAGDFVPVNMAALPESLVESVLFGHEKGAFTGADKRSVGLCHQADRGTLFLDEIGEMSRDLQPKLLRFLQEYTVQRVGSTHVEQVDVRVISATNRNLRELIGNGGFREDLYFRLNVIPVFVPPLRDRRDDIPVLANAFLKRKCQRLGREIAFCDSVIERLCDYDWPGNIRQLENLIERMVVLTPGDVIEACAIPLESFARTAGQGASSLTNGHFVADLEETIVLNDRQLTRMETAERNLIMHALHRHEGNVSAAARFLGLGQATIYRKIRDFEIPKLAPRKN